MGQGNLGQRVRDARKARDLSQEALAREAGVSLNLVNKLERGVVTDPHYSTLSGLAHALELSVEDLVRGEARQPELEDERRPDLGELLKMSRGEFDAYAETLSTGALSKLAGDVNREAQRLLDEAKQAMKEGSPDKGTRAKAADHALTLAMIAILQHHATLEREAKATEEQRRRLETSRQELEALVG